MRYVVALAMAAAIGGAGVAVASDHEHETASRSQERVISADVMKARIDKLGYDIRRTKKDDDQYRAHLIDRDSGGAVKATFDGKTGELIRAQMAEEKHDSRKDGEPREERAAHHGSRD
jgi:hypothetical protein